MNIKQRVDYLFGKSLKEIEMEKILAKKRKNKPLSEREVNFYNLYLETTFIDIDYMMISKNEVYTKIKKILSLNKVIICNLRDRDGYLGYEIDDVINDYDDEYGIVIMKGDMRCKIEDRFLYNIVYNQKRDRYSLELHGEYFEKINIEK